LREVEPRPVAHDASDPYLPRARVHRQDVKQILIGVVAAADVRREAGELGPDGADLLQQRGHAPGDRR
jgi:hypothetical protein